MSSFLPVLNLFPVLSACLISFVFFVAQPLQGLCFVWVVSPRTSWESAFGSHTNSRTLFEAVGSPPEIHSRFIQCILQSDTRGPGRSEVLTSENQSQRSHHHARTALIERKLYMYRNACYPSLQLTPQTTITGIIMRRWLLISHLPLISTHPNLVNKLPKWAEKTNTFLKNSRIPKFVLHSFEYFHLDNNKKDEIWMEYLWSVKSVCLVISAFSVQQ